MAGSLRSFAVRHRRRRAVQSAVLTLVAALAGGCDHLASRLNPPAATRPLAADEIMVAPGDTVYSLSRRHGVAMRDLVTLNSLSRPDVLQVGQILRLPQNRFHFVEAGETLQSIARAHGVDADLLAAVNRLPPPYVVKAGEALRLPGGPAVAAVPQPRPEPPAPVASPRPAVEAAAIAPVPVTTGPIPVPPPAGARPAAGPTVTAVAPRPTAPGPTATQPIPAVAPGPAPAAPPPAPPAPAPAAEAPPRGGAKFLWPIKGRILASFRTGTEDTQTGGINIAAPKGSPVLAADNGVVLYASDLKGYGNLLLVRHAGGFVTAYAHLEKILVAKNDKVTRGQRIATVGSTGSVTAPQLHFELRKDGQPVDPAKYLEPL